MKRLSELQGVEVTDEDGKKIGHVFDVLTEHDAPDQPPRIKEFLVGSGGLARRLGIRRGSARAISVEDVLRIEPGRITAQTGPERV